MGFQATAREAACFLQGFATARGDKTPQDVQDALVIAGPLFAGFEIGLPNEKKLKDLATKIWRQRVRGEEV